MDVLPETASRAAVSTAEPLCYCIQARLLCLTRSSSPCLTTTSAAITSANIPIFLPSSRSHFLACASAPLPRCPATLSSSFPLTRVPAGRGTHAAAAGPAAVSPGRHPENPQEVPRERSAGSSPPKHPRFIQLSAFAQDFAERTRQPETPRPPDMLLARADEVIE